MVLSFDAFRLSARTFTSSASSCAPRARFGGGRLSRLLFILAVALVAGSGVVASAASDQKSIDVPDADYQVILDLVDRIQKGAGDPGVVVDFQVFDEFLTKVSANESKSLIWELRADEAGRRGDKAEVRRCNEMIVNSYSDTIRFPNAVESLVDVCSETGDFEGMLAASMRGVEHAKSDVKRIHFIGKAATALVALNQAEEAVSLLDEGFQKHPDQQAALLTITNNVGASAFGRGEQESAKRLFLLAYEHAPASERSLTLLVNVANAKAMTGDLTGAIETHKEAIRQHAHRPERASNVFAIGVLLIQIGDFESAKKSFEEFLSMTASEPANFQKMREKAEANLRMIAVKLGGRLPRQDSEFAPVEVGGGKWKWLVGANVAIITALLIGWFVRRRAVSR